jgi:hypothetical protein
MPQCSTIVPGGPLRIVAWSTWSGRERSSHSHFLQVPQTRLASFLGVDILRTLKSHDVEVHVFDAISPRSAIVLIIENIFL